jgi:hypothetical protein
MQIRLGKDQKIGTDYSRDPFLISAANSCIEKSTNPPNCSPTFRVQLTDTARPAAKTTRPRHSRAFLGG